MVRACSNCGSNLTERPALQGLRGLLCFPCRYRLDETGGEAYVLAAKEFPRIQAAWDHDWRARWEEYQKRLGTAESLDTVVIFVTFATFAAFWLVGAGLGFAGILIVGVLSLVARLLKRSAERHRCEAPPVAPSPQSGLLRSKPQLVFDEPTNQSGDSIYDRYNGYPPDWDRRKAACLSRDGHVCQLCGNRDRLHVHHVWPVSYSSLHTPQNLITLCNACHMQQGYWNHADLVTQNIHANKKYDVKSYVRSDGVVVRGHSRKIGRRGWFWNQVGQERRRQRRKRYEQT